MISLSKPRGLRKSFHGHSGANGLGFEVPAGSIFGFLGCNGAGKTTTIKLLMGMLKAGRRKCHCIWITDFRSQQFDRSARRIGFVTEEKELYPVHDGGPDYSVHAAIFS